MMSTDHQISELLPFLLHDDPRVVNVALVNLLPYTVQTSPQRHLFLSSKSEIVEHDRGYIKVFAGLSRAAYDESTKQAALTALVNLSDSVSTCSKIASLDGYIQWLISQILDESPSLANLACMLLANLTQLGTVCKACLEVEDSKDNGKRLDSIQSLDRLVTIFAREGDKRSNYDYLAHVFANLSAVTTEEGRKGLLGMPASLTKGSTSKVPLADLVQFTEHPSATRRVGIASTLKNCAFAQEAHPLLLSSGSVNFLPYILLPLCGPEEFDLEEEEKMPSEIQFLGEEKKREPEASTRLMLVETLILLCGERNGRENLRSRGVYEVVRVAHKAEKDEQVRTAIERLVNLLQRGESGETKIEPLSASTKADDDDLVIEV